MKLKVLLAVFDQKLGDPSSVGLPATSIDSAASSIVSTVFVVLGAVSLFFIVIGTFRYSISGGNPNDTARAKETIIYAIVGLVVALIAFGAVNLISTKVNG